MFSGVPADRTVIARALLPRVLSHENMQHARRDPDGGCQEWPGRYAPLFMAQLSQDFVDGLLIFNAGYDSDSIPATVTTLNVNIEDAFQALRPGHGCVTLDGRPHPSKLTRNSFSTPQKIIRAVITVSHSPLPQPRSSCC